MTEDCKLTTCGLHDCEYSGNCREQKHEVCAEYRKNFVKQAEEKMGINEMEKSCKTCRNSDGVDCEAGAGDCDPYEFQLWEPKQTEKKMKDPKSRYYSAGGLETLDIIKAKLTPEQYQGFLLGNIIKYACRANFKDQMERDMEKINFYSSGLDKK